jgi:hypothetical protein
MKWDMEIERHTRTESHRATRYLATWCSALALGAAPACGGSSSSGTPSTATHPEGGVDPYASCTWDIGAGTQVTGAAPTQNDAADLGGAAIGTQVFDSTQQRRTVTLNVTTPLPGLALGQAYLTRLTATDETAYLTIPVTYTGTGYPCFIQAKTYRWLSATGQMLNSTNGPYLDGSVGAATSMIYTDTCLTAGDSGYFIEIELATAGAPLYSAVASIELGLSSTTVGTAPAAKLLPTRYDVGTCSSTRTLRVEATAGSAKLAVGNANSSGSLGPVILLDSAGLPAGWTFVSQKQPANFAPGTTTHFYANLPFEPAVSRAQFFLPFDPPNPMFMSLPGFMLNAMQDIEAARSSRAQRWQTAIDLATTAAAR